MSTESSSAGKWIARFVLPASAAFTALYTGSFTFAVATAERESGGRDPSDFVTSGEIKPGWLYEVNERSWPRSYTLDVKGIRAGAGAVCAVEVKGYPKPIMAAPGPGTRLRVVFDGPLEGATSSMLEVDLMDGTAVKCAARVTNGVVMDPGLDPNATPVTADTGAPELRVGLSSAGG
jgi:hypothetical protein